MSGAAMQPLSARWLALLALPMLLQWGQCACGAGTSPSDTPRAAAERRFGATTAAVSVNWNMRRSVGGVSDFGRERHMNVHSINTDGDWTGEAAKMDELMNGLDVYFGRDTGQTTFAFKQTPNDTAVPDTFSPSGLAAEAAAFRAAYDSKRDRIAYEGRQRDGMILSTIPHPLYPTLDWNPEGFTRVDHWQPKSINTSAAWVVRYLAEFFRPAGSPAGANASGPMLPRYWEVINEPDMELMTGQFMVSNWESLWAYHNLVARGVRAQLGESAPLIGGMTFGLHDLNKPDIARHTPDYLRQWIPNKTVADFYEHAAETRYPSTGQPWEQWDKIWSGFVDHCGSEVDFYSIHLYDWPSWQTGGSGHIRTGGHVEALLDLLEWYDVRRHGRRAPVIVSEYGCASGYEKILGLDRKRQDWESLKPFSGMLMQFLARPDYILKTMPFTPIKAQWGDDVDAQGKLHKYPNKMMDNATGTWEWTDFILQTGHASTQSRPTWTCKPTPTSPREVGGRT